LPQSVRFGLHTLHGLFRERRALHWPGSEIHIEGRERRHAVRNSCPVCGSLVFGGEVGKDASFTIYAGTLDDPSLFHPTVAIFTRGRPDWAVIPPDLKVFERAP
jgi:hypothetical protein